MRRQAGGSAFCREGQSSAEALALVRQLCRLRAGLLFGFCLVLFGMAGGQDVTDGDKSVWRELGRMFREENTGVNWEQ